MKVHALKTWPEFFKKVGKEKTFEVRKDDRGFEVGDVLWLQEWEPKDKNWTGRDKKFTVTYIMRGEEWGIKDGYCVLGLGPHYARRGA